MVTKLKRKMTTPPPCLILAKIHMVTKPVVSSIDSFKSLILAKIHMVTKHAC